MTYVFVWEDETVSRIMILRAKTCVSCNSIPGISNEKKRCLVNPSVPGTQKIYLRIYQYNCCVHKSSTFVRKG